MKYSANTRRRGRNNRRQPNSSRNQTMDSNGPDVRIRGTANQIHEKYLALAKDAAASGDRVMAESYMQHAEHYQRVINAFAPPAEQENQVSYQDLQDVEASEDGAKTGDAVWQQSSESGKTEAGVFAEA